MKLPLVHRFTHRERADLEIERPPTDREQFTLSKFDYTYNGVGNILTWRQQADTAAVLWEYGYDAAAQLTAAIKRATDPQQTVLKRYAYAYDPAGNRIVEQIDDVVTGATYNNVNELVSQQPSGGMLFSGQHQRAGDRDDRKHRRTGDGGQSVSGDRPGRVGLEHGEHHGHGPKRQRRDGAVPDQQQRDREDVYL